MILTVLMSLLGIFLGFLGAQHLSEAGFLSLFDRLFKGLFLLALSLVLATFVHEAGHLIAGGLTGYRFLSFMVFGWVLYRRGEVLAWGRFHLPGALGQALMLPPERPPEKLPYIAYNLGGILANLLTGSLALLLAFFWKPGAMPFFIFAGCSFFLGILNALPLKLQGIATDGYHLMLMKNSLSAREAFAKSLYLQKRDYDGKDLATVPGAYLETAHVDDDELSNMLYLYAFEHALARMALEEAALRGAALLKRRIHPLHQSLIRSELCFLSLLETGADGQGYAKGLEALWKAFPLPSLLRTQIAYQRIQRQDEAAAARLEAKRLQVSKRTPMRGSLLAEERLLKALASAR